MFLTAIRRGRAGREMDMSLKDLGRLIPKLLIFIMFAAIILPASGFLTNLTTDQYMDWLVPVARVVLSCLAAIAVIVVAGAYWRRRKHHETPDEHQP